MATTTTTSTTALADLDKFMDYLSGNGTSTTKNYFDSDEYKSFKQLSLDLADKNEARDLRLMDKAAIKRNQEYQRNYSEASGLFNAGQSIGYSPRGTGQSNGSIAMGSGRHDGMS